jgi:hypothetical protein
MEEVVEESYENHVVLLKLVPGRDNVTNDNIQECMNQDKEQQLNDDADLVHHAGDAI